MHFRICSYLLFSALAMGACVDDTDTSTEEASVRDHRRPPPPEAIDACDGSAAGATCAFDAHDHHVTGTCRAAPAGVEGPLACAPDRPPPPLEAIAACDGAAAADVCAFDIDGHHVDGTCRLSPDGDGPLACAPNNPPPLPPH